MKYPWALLSCAILVFASPAFSFASEISGARPLSVSRIGDLELSCAQLSEEAWRMENIIQSTQDMRDVSRQTNTGIGVAGTIGGFLVGTVTGGIGFAAAGIIAKEANDDRAEDAEEVQDIATKRQALMTGIAQAKGCPEPLEESIESSRETDSTIELADTKDDAAVPVPPQKPLIH